MKIIIIRVPVAGRDFMHWQQLGQKDTYRSVPCMDPHIPGCFISVSRRDWLEWIPVSFQRAHPGASWKKMGGRGRERDLLPQTGGSRLSIPAVCWTEHARLLKLVFCQVAVGLLLCPSSPFIELRQSLFRPTCFRSLLSVEQPCSLFFSTVSTTYHALSPG